MLRRLERGWRLLLLALAVAGCGVYQPDLLASSGAPAQGESGNGAAGTSASGGVSGDGTLGGTGGAGAVAGGGTAGSGGVGGTEDLTKAYVRGATKVPPISVDLSREGFRDWAHWGLATVDDYNHKADVTSSLMDFKPLGSALPKFNKGGPITFNWSDGTPVVSATTPNGIFWTGANQGFELKSPAGDEELLVNLYIGVTAGTAEIKASVSDPDATSELEDHINSPVGAWNLRVLTVQYGFAAPDSVLTVTLKVIDPLDATAAVSLNGVTWGGP